MSDERIALRLDSRKRLDDVYVKNVSMFRAEMMDDSWLWMACYLPDTGAEHDRITFGVHAYRGKIVFRDVERPSGLVTFEPGAGADD
jgi:hypothetical protein